MVKHMVKQYTTLEHKNAALKISIVIFGLITVLHLLRLFNEWPVTIAGWNVPLKASVLAAGAAFGLAYWMYQMVKR